MFDFSDVVMCSLAHPVQHYICDVLRYESGEHDKKLFLETPGMCFSVVLI